MKISFRRFYALLVVMGPILTQYSIGGQLDLDLLLFLFVVLFSVIGGFHSKGTQKNGIILFLLYVALVTGVNLLIGRHFSRTSNIILRCGKYWLVKASAPEEVLKAYESVDFFDEERDAKQAAVIGECAIESVTDLETLALSREELDQWTGKSGQDMLDAGWELNGWHSEGNGLLVIMVNGSFQYNVSFGDTVETPEWGGELKMEEGVVDSITFAGPSYSFSVE